MPRRDTRKSRFVLRQAEAGEKISEICREVGISEATYYAWKKQYAGWGQ
jgi:putative transposase